MKLTQMFQNKHNPNYYVTMFSPMVDGKADVMTEHVTYQYGFIETILNWIIGNAMPHTVIIKREHKHDEPLNRDDWIRINYLEKPSLKADRVIIERVNK